MALFGSNWLEDDNDDIGPFSHWLEDDDDDTNLFSHWKKDNDCDWDKAIPGHFKDDTVINEFTEKYNDNE